MFVHSFKKELSARTGLTLVEVHNFLVDYYTLMGEEMVKMQEGDRLLIKEFGYFEKITRKSQVIKSIDGIEKPTKPIPNIKFHVSPSIRDKFKEDGDESEEEEL